MERTERAWRWDRPEAALAVRSLGATRVRAQAGRSRRDLMAGLRALAPLVSALGGSEAVGEAFGAIEEVGRWWP